ncbi:GNAT family protein [uncultured Methanoregula sp.]|uniref:GNAT family N-acetyltransferase n=1 Tax=uncultured Methanoregula sp. TaxID=1005933 RepID=UPI002AAAD9C8|nr:GNAT family protein [uncultured Methanoregula sp.]
MYLQTKKAILRPWSAADAGSISRHANNPRITACMRDAFPHPYTLEDAHRFIEMAGSTKNLLLAIETGGEAVGGIGIHYLEDVYRGTGEIGYWLSESFRGQGIVTDAVRSLVPVVFQETDLIRIHAGIFANNPASMRVLEKSGFLREAIHKNAITKNGVVMDEIVYTILKKDAGDQTGKTRLP